MTWARILLGIALLAIALMLQGRGDAVAQGEAGSFSNDFLDDAGMNFELTRNWNTAWDVCNRAEPQSTDCTISHAARSMPHGTLLLPYCTADLYYIDRHICVVMGSVAADLVFAFGVGTVDGFIKEHGPDRIDSIYSAGRLIWAALDQRCSPSSLDCQIEQITARLQIGVKDIGLCRRLTKSVIATRAEADCLIARRVERMLAEANAKL